MIIIRREYNIANPCGGRPQCIVTRKVFHDDDIKGVQSFLDERSVVSGYKWFNLHFDYTKI